MSTFLVLFLSNDFNAEMINGWLLSSLLTIIFDILYFSWTFDIFLYRGIHGLFAQPIICVAIALFLHCTGNSHNVGGQVVEMLTIDKDVVAGPSNKEKVSKCKILTILY